MSERGNKTFIEFPGASPEKHEVLPIIDENSAIDPSKGLGMGMKASPEFQRHLNEVNAARQAVDTARLNEARKNVVFGDANFQAAANEAHRTVTETETAAIEAELKVSPAKKAWTSIKKFFGA